LQVEALVDADVPVDLEVAATEVQTGIVRLIDPDEEGRKQKDTY
jgi:hypothetical protein